MATHEQQLGDAPVAVDDEPFDAAEIVGVGGGDAAAAAELDLALGDAVVDEAHVRIDDGPEHGVVAGAQVRLDDGGLDADVPAGVLGAELAQSQVGELLDGGQPLDVRGVAREPHVAGVRRPADQRERDEAGAGVLLAVVDDEVRDRRAGRVDDDVGDAADLAVAAGHGHAELEPASRLGDRIGGSHGHSLGEPVLGWARSRLVTPEATRHGLLGPFTPGVVFGADGWSRNVMLWPPWDTRTMRSAPARVTV